MDFSQEALSSLLSTPFSQQQIQQVQQLYELLIEANRIHNLTRIVSEADFYARHLVDSLTLVPFLSSFSGQFALVDVGSGAGFPALPLAILFPKANIVAIESVQKKAAFIRDAAQILGLSCVQVLAQRSEVVAHQSEYREAFDIATARAVSSLNSLSELCLPLVKCQGWFLPMKTLTQLQEEQALALPVIAHLGGQLENVTDVSTEMLPNRAILQILKVKKTPRQYPRKSGLPQKKPLTTLFLEQK